MKFLLSFFFVISTSGNLFCQEPIDSLKIGKEYQECEYLYSDNLTRSYTVYDSTREIMDTFYGLKINSIKRLYKVSNIYSFVNVDGIEYNLIEITDYSEHWLWTIISEKDSDSCEEMLEVNKSYYMTIYYLKNEDSALRLPYDSTVRTIFKNNVVWIDSNTRKTRMVYSPNIKGRCFIPTD